MSRWRKLGQTDLHYSRDGEYSEFVGIFSRGHYWFQHRCDNHHISLRERRKYPGNSIPEDVMYCEGCNKEFPPYKKLCMMADLHDFQTET